MQQKHVFRGNFFGKSDFGHFFCPFLKFPKYFQSKKTPRQLQRVDSHFMQNPMTLPTSCSKNATLKGTYLQFCLKFHHHKLSCPKVYTTL
jgi:hypothetical protein